MIRSTLFALFAATFLGGLVFTPKFERLLLEISSRYFSSAASTAVLGWVSASNEWTCAGRPRGCPHSLPVVVADVHGWGDPGLAYTNFRGRRVLMRHTFKAFKRVTYDTKQQRFADLFFAANTTELEEVRRPLAIRPCNACSARRASVDL